MRPVCLGVMLSLGCTQVETGRDEANLASAQAQLTSTLSVRVSGGAVVATEPAQGDLPPRVRVRAQSLDLRIEVRDTGCAPAAVVLEVSHLPAEGVVARWRPLLDGLAAEALAAREAAAAAVDFIGDPDDRDRTPLAASRALVPAVVEGVRLWTVRTDRNAGLTLVSPGAVPVSVDPGPGACADLEVAGASDLAQAALVVRHRLRRRVQRPFRFAVWGNNGGNSRVRERIAAAVNEAASAAVPAEERVLFAVIGGDLTADGSAGQLEAAADELDTLLAVPWFATVGDHDVLAGLKRTPVEAFGATTFAFDVGATRIMVLDSADAVFTERSFGLLGDWLEDTPLWWPSAAAPPSRLLITHVPPFDPYGTRGGGFRSRQDAARVIATLRRAGVPLVLTHSFATFTRQDVAGVEVVHAGGAGAPIESDSTIGHHWLAVDVGADCSPPKALGSTPGARCEAGDCEVGADGRTRCPCAGGLWCDGTCTPCLQVSVQPL